MLQLFRRIWSMRWSVCCAAGIAVGFYAAGARKKICQSSSTTLSSRFASATSASTY